jgi:hypothetical protein
MASQGKMHIAQDVVDLLFPQAGGFRVALDSFANLGNCTFLWYWQLLR